jgi:hypothetical protein
MEGFEAPHFTNDERTRPRRRRTKHCVAAEERKKAAPQQNQYNTEEASKGASCLSLSLSSAKTRGAFSHSAVTQGGVGSSRSGCFPTTASLLAAALFRRLLLLPLRGPDDALVLGLGLLDALPAAEVEQLLADVFERRKGVGLLRINPPLLGVRRAGFVFGLMLLVG